MEPLIPHFDLSTIPLFGNVAVTGSGVLLGLGLLLGAWTAARKAQCDGLDVNLIYRLLVWTIAGSFVGGHLGHILFYNPETLFADPFSLLRVRSGLSSYGAFIGCAMLAIWFFRRENSRRITAASPQPPIDPWAYADAGIYGFAFGWFLARMGCFSVHDHPGVPTDFWLGVYGICPGGPPDAACHDLGFYEAIWSLGIFVLFTLLDRKPRFSGFFVGLLFVTYGPSRFFADFLRHPLTDVRYLGLTPAQYGSLGMLALGVWVLWQRPRREPA